MTERLEIEIALLRSDMVDKINVHAFGSMLADEGLEHLKLAEKAVAEVRKEVKSAIDGLTRRMAVAVEEQRKDCLVGMARLHAKQGTVLAKLIAGKVDPLAATVKRLTDDFAILRQILVEHEILAPEPAPVAVAIALLTAQ